MSKYVIEIESLKDGLLILYADAPGQHMRFAPGTRQNPSVLPVTVEQFKAHAYDIEGHTEGKFGISEPDAQLWVRDADSGVRERVTFAEASEFIAGGVLSDEAAHELQKQATVKAKADRKKKSGNSGGNHGGAREPGPGDFAPVDALTET